MKKLCLYLGLLLSTYHAKDLVLGCATGYGKQELSIFVNSLRFHSPSCDIALILSRDKYKKDHEFFKKNHIIPLFFESARWIPTRIHYARSGKYLDFLLEHPLYDRIFLADTRDVVFQGDLFSKTPIDQKFLWLFEESLTIGEDLTFNYMWITNHFGKDTADSLKEKTVQCSGTVFASYEYMIKYLEKMVYAKTKEDLWTKSKEFGEESVENILDQALQNVLFYSGKLAFAEAKKNGDIVFTASTRQNTRVNKNGIIYFENNVPLIVHQYDRDFEMKMKIEKKWNRKSNP